MCANLCVVKKHRKAQTVRRSVALPRRLVEEISALVPHDAAPNWNRLVISALEEYAERRRRIRFERAMEAMTCTRITVLGSPGEEVRKTISGCGPIYLQPFGGFLVR